MTHCCSEDGESGGGEEGVGGSDGGLEVILGRGAPEEDKGSVGGGKGGVPGRTGKESHHENDWTLAC